MSNRPFVPSFLKNLDNNLLRNKPGAWASRAHLVIYFSLLFSLLLFIFCYFVFFDVKQYSNIETWNVLVALVVFVGLVFWLIYLLRFNVFKRYGNWFSMDGLRDFLLYFVSIGAMIATCFVPSAVETWRANQQFGNEELVNDINEINMNACRLEYNLLPLAWDSDTCQVVEMIHTAPVEVTPETVIMDTVTTVNEYVVSPRYRRIDTAMLREEITNADSLLKINDSLYVFYDCPDYRFVSTYNADEYSSVKLMSSADIYNRVIKNYQAPDRPALTKRMQEFQTKYAVRSRYGDYYDNSDEARYDVKIRRKYNLSQINNGIDNVVEKKYAWADSWHIYIRVFYYITLLLTMLVFIFRHSTAKTFFLSVLVAVLLVIISGLILVVFSPGEEQTMLSFILLYYVVFAVLALSIFGTKLRRAAQGIGLNLFLYMTPFIPLLLVALKKSMDYKYAYVDTVNAYPDPAKTALYLLMAEIGGGLLLLLLLQPLFKKLYRKWYASPEE